MTRKDLANMIDNQSAVNGFVVLSKEKDTTGHYTYTIKDAQGVVTSGLSFAKVAKILGGEVVKVTEGGSKKKETVAGLDTAKILKLEVSTPTELTEKVINALVTDSKRMEVYLTKVSEVAPTLLDTYQNVICECVDIVSKHMYKVFYNSANDRKAKALSYMRKRDEKIEKEALIKRQESLVHRSQVLYDYIRQYDAKVGAAFIAGNAEKAQMLAIQKSSRVARANEIINSINILIEE